MKKWTLLLTIAVALTAIAAVRAEDKEQPKKHEGGPHQMRMEGLLPPMLVEKLNLTADQKAKYDESCAAFKKDAEQYKKDHPISDADREAMKKARESGDKEAMKKFAETFKGLGEIRKGYIEKFEATLTDEQKKTMADARENMKKHVGAARGAHKPAESK